MGAVYLSLFPRRGDRFALDSVGSPRAIGRDTWRRMGPAVELRFPDFTRFAAERNDVYGLGTPDNELRAKYFELGGRLDATSVTLPDGQVIDGPSSGTPRTTRCGRTRCSRVSGATAVCPLGDALDAEQRALGVQSAGVAAQPSAAGEHAVAGNDDRDRIGSQRVAGGAECPR